MRNLFSTMLGTSVSALATLSAFINNTSTTRDVVRTPFVSQTDNAEALARSYFIQDLILSACGTPAVALCNPPKVYRQPMELSAEAQANADENMARIQFRRFNRWVRNNGNDLSRAPRHIRAIAGM